MMYTPAHFTEASPAKLHAIIRSHPLGTLVTAGPDGFDATHIPFLLSGDGKSLRGHIARPNPIAKRAGSEVLVVFLGDHHYISPNWYASKASDPRVVPTWNYVAVHVHGALRVFEDPTELRAFVAELTAAHEAAQPHPWSIDDAPSAYIDKLVTHIVGVEISIARLEGKCKLSQNRSREDRASVAEALADDPVSALVRETL